MIYKSRDQTLSTTSRIERKFQVFYHLWQYRQFIISSIRNEFILHVIRSKLGMLWLIANPLLQVLIYSYIFSSRLGMTIPGVNFKFSYIVFLLSGFLAWSFFSDMVNRCLVLFIRNGDLIKKMKFPHTTLPIITTGTALINNLLLFISLLMLFLILGHKPTINLLWLLPCFFSLCAFSLGLGLILGIINVFVRDTGQAMSFILQIWYWLTPIVYHPTIIPESSRIWLNLNPLYPIVTAYQDVILYGHRPDLSSLLKINLFIFVLLLFSFLLFRGASKDMADVL